MNSFKFRNSFPQQGEQRERTIRDGVYNANKKGSIKLIV